MSAQATIETETTHRADGTHAIRSSDLLPSPIYKDTLVEIYHGDCREIMPMLPRGLVVSDPPYNVGYHYEEYADAMSEDDYMAMLKDVCPPPCVTTAHSGAKPSTCSASFFMKLSGMKSGK